jgi:hypothetical protein
MPLSIKGIDRPLLLAALHDGTAAVGMGVWSDLGRSMSREEAEQAIAERSGRGEEISFDYVHGRPIKVCFIGDELRGERLYDRDCPTGDGSCARIVEGLRK